jgi:hypothetical protein
MNSSNRKAHQVNERSADQPMVASNTGGGVRRRGSPKRGGHGHGHGHAHGPSRPWMIGH